MNCQLQLYGDGIHDDFPAIQEMLNSGVSCVYLPSPKVNYLISATLKIHSNQTLKLDSYTLIKLADHADCCMAENADPEHWNTNITLDGGIWDMNHKNQRPNPYHFPDEYGKKYNDYIRELNFSADNRLFPNTYTGHCFRFNSIKGFEFRNITIRHPVVYGGHFGFIENFTVENIIFDYTEGSPKLWNLDGVHFEGGCRNGVIRNLKGACHDDLVALTSDDGLNGDIDNILIDGIFAEGCHSALRMLSYKHHIKNVHLTNVFGTFYLYVACMTKYYNVPDSVGRFENIVIDNVFASFCKGTVDVPGNYEPFLVIGDNVHVTRLKIENFIREESVCPLPTVGIGKNTFVDNLEMDNVHLENKTDNRIICVLNNGIIKRFTAVNCICENASFLENKGIIEKANI